jgi:hypothetical protein
MANDPGRIRTCNLSQFDENRKTTRYHCATRPLMCVCAVVVGYGTGVEVTRVMFSCLS